MKDTLFNIPFLMAETKRITFVLTAVAETVYTEATPEQLEQLQQQGIQYDVIAFTEE